MHKKDGNLIVFVSTLTALVSINQLFCLGKSSYEIKLIGKGLRFT